MFAKFNSISVPHKTLAIWAPHWNQDQNLGLGSSKDTNMYELKASSGNFKAHKY